MKRNAEGDVVSLNNNDREEWIRNDEVLYKWKMRSGLSMRNFIRENRAELDRAIIAGLNCNSGENYFQAMYDSLNGVSR